MSPLRTLDIGQSLAVGDLIVVGGVECDRIPVWNLQTLWELIQESASRKDVRGGSARAHGYYSSQQVLCQQR